MTFNKLGLNIALITALKNYDILKPTAVQQQAIPAVLDKKDVIAIAPTGSGKTLSYVLPILNNFKKNTAADRSPAILVIVPTRELATQVSEVFISYSKKLEELILIRTVTGGSSVNTQMQDLARTHILVATPGRLLELIEKNAIQLNKIKTLVLDEADKLLSLGFSKEVTAIMHKLPVIKQSLLYSATLSDNLTALTNNVWRKPVFIDLTNKEELDLSLIKQLGYRVSLEKKGVLLRHLIQQHDMQQVIIFCSSTYQVEHVNDKLNVNEIKSKALHGKKKQSVRNKNLTDFKNGAVTGVRCLVTTDLLARGIDISELPYVINYELPRSPKDYIHRIGRTGRAGATGTAISLVTPDEAHHMRVIQKKTGLKVWMEDLPEWK